MATPIRVIEALFRIEDAYAPPTAAPLQDPEPIIR